MVNEFNRRRLWAFAFGVGGVLLAKALLDVDGKQPVLMLAGLVLGFVVVFGAIWAGLKLHELRCPHCGERFSPLGQSLFSGRCASCQRSYTDA